MEWRPIDVIFIGNRRNTAYRSNTAVLKFLNFNTAVLSSIRPYWNSEISMRPYWVHCGCIEASIRPYWFQYGRIEVSETSIRRIEFTAAVLKLQYGRIKFSTAVLGFIPSTSLFWAILRPLDLQRTLLGPSRSPSGWSSFSLRESSSFISDPDNFRGLQLPPLYLVGRPFGVSADK